METEGLEKSWRDFEFSFLFDATSFMMVVAVLLACVIYFFLERRERKAAIRQVHALESECEKLQQQQSDNEAIIQQQREALEQQAQQFQEQQQQFQEQQQQHQQQVHQFEQQYEQQQQQYQEQHLEQKEQSNQLELELVEYKTQKLHLKQQVDQLQQRLDQDQQRIEQLQQAREQLAVALKETQTQQHLEQVHLEQRNQWFQDTKKQMTEQFEHLARQNLHLSQEQFSKQQQTELNHLLKPFKEQLSHFQKKVEHTYDQENRDRHSLLYEISQLKTLNQQMSAEATQLTRALKGDNKAQGNWGEVVLERVLERSGLRKDHEYEVQTSFQDEQGKRQIPDVIVRLPDQKDLVIDAKVSLIHYEAYTRAEQDSERVFALKAFKKSLKQHLEGLSQKHYAHLPGLRTLDFVFMFMPIEAAFLLALEEEPQLFAEAYERNIILVSPSTLLATLRTVQSIWRYERQNANAEKMAEVAGGLYDQCVRVIESLQTLGKQLQRTQETYDKTLSQLYTGRGNLVNRAEKLENLGARVKKRLPASSQTRISSQNDTNSRNQSNPHSQTSLEI